MREEDGEAGRNPNSHGAVSSSNQQWLQQGNTRNPAIEDHYMESSGRRGGTLQCPRNSPALSRDGGGQWKELELQLQQQRESRRRWKSGSQNPFERTVKPAAAHLSVTVAHVALRNR